MADMNINPLKRIFGVLKFQKKEISAIYFYAILSGLVQLSLPLGTQSIINFVMGGYISTSLILLIIFVVIGVFIFGLLQINQMKLIEKIQQQIFVRYGFQFTYIIPRLNLKSVDNYYLPELVNRFFDTGTLQKGISKLLLDIPTATIQIIFGLLLLSFYHPAFIFFGIVLVVLLYLILRFSGIRGLQTAIEQSDYKYKVAGWLEELARAVTTFKFSKGAPIDLQKADDHINGYLQAKTAHFKVLLFQYWTLVIFKLFITSAMLVVGSLLLVNQQINIGQFIGAELVILTVIGSVEKLITNLDVVYEVLTAAEKLAKVTDKTIEDNGSIMLPISNTGLKVSVNDLSFSYPDGKQVLSNVSFEVNSGEVLCVRGKNSSGKSTLLRIISGAYQPFGGTISFDNISISNYNLSSLRSQTGVLLNMQDIFSGTVIENITMGNANADMKDIQYLAELTGLSTFIKKDKDGYERVLHPTGRDLPNGIIHKILLVRALSNRPRLLLLEEPWLGLEEEAMKRVQDYLLHHPNAPTTIVVADDDENFATKCNQVIIMEEGNIVKQIKNH